MTPESQDETPISEKTFSFQLGSGLVTAHWIILHPHRVSGQLPTILVSFFALYWDRGRCENFLLVLTVLSLSLDGRRRRLLREALASPQLLAIV